MKRAVPHSAPDRRARLAWTVATIVIATGATVAASRFPGGYDWRYEVVSALASHKYNPEGGAWFSVSLAISLLCFWPVTTRLRHALRQIGRRTAWQAWPVGFLRAGLVGGSLVGLERALFYHVSAVIHQGHEIAAFISFVALFCGMLGASIPGLQRKGTLRWLTVILLLPLIGVGVSELLLYLDQRDIGWADFDWRATGLPVWLSFAFWQWLAVLTLWLGFFALAWLPFRQNDEQRPGTTSEDEDNFTRKPPPPHPHAPSA